MIALFLIACLPDDWVDPSIYAALDYHIDRPRVGAIRFDPLWVAAGEPVTISALVFGPNQPKRIVASLCGLREDVLVDVRSVDCFENPKLVEKLGDVPAVYVPDPLPETWVGAHSVVPVLVEGRFGHTSAYGMVEMDVLAEVPLEPPATPLASYGIAVEALDAPVGGTAVRLQAKVFHPSADVEDVRWYVDRGTLRGTGRTVPHFSTARALVSENALELPRKKGPLRVIAVADGLKEGDMAWASTTLDVR